MKRILKNSQTNKITNEFKSKSSSFFEKEDTEKEYEDFNPFFLNFYSNKFL
jgi:hypothetical protein